MSGEPEAGPDARRAGAGLVVRRLRPGDATGYRGAMAVFAEAFGEPETYLGAPPGAAYRDELLADPGFVALLAVSNDEAVGALAAYELRKFERERSEIYLYDLAVAETHRRQGIATAMIERLKEIARARGAYVVFVQADYGDDAAIALYAKLGQREDVLHFDIEVAAEPSSRGGG